MSRNVQLFSRSLACCSEKRLYSFSDVIASNGLRLGRRTGRSGCITTEDPCFQTLCELLVYRLLLGDLIGLLLHRGSGIFDRAHKIGSVWLSGFFGLFCLIASCLCGTDDDVLCFAETGGNDVSGCFGARGEQVSCICGTSSGRATFTLIEIRGVAVLSLFSSLFDLLLRNSDSAAGNTESDRGTEIDPEIELTCWQTRGPCQRGSCSHPEALRAFGLCCPAVAERAASKLTLSLHRSKWKLTVLSACSLASPAFWPARPTRPACGRVLSNQPLEAMKRVRKTCPLHSRRCERRAGRQRPRWSLSYNPRSVSRHTLQSVNSARRTSPCSLSVLPV